jgi:site-specific DNA-methyltransferase (cytosine-N4-specific)
MSIGVSEGVREAQQLDLFGSILGVYLKGGEPVDNDKLYDAIVETGQVDRDEMERREPIGRAGTQRSVAKRKVRWYQQTLKKLGLVERVPERRGWWRATAKAKAELTPAPPRVVMLGFSTELGVGLWASCGDVFGQIDEPITLCLTSPPYALARPRAYGNPDQKSYVDFICSSLEGVVKHLVRGGMLALNISNDIFEPGSPARSMINERLTLAMADRLGLSLMERLVWNAPSKAPGPIQWASKKRMQLNVGWEPVLIFCNDPHAAVADNRRVLQEHTERHLKLMRGGGENREGVFGDGAYRLKKGSFGEETAGRIPKNVLTFGHQCGELMQLRKLADEAGLPRHGATMPLRLAKFLVEWLSRPGDLVADPFAGWFTSCKAAEALGRRWIGTELMLEHVLGARPRFAGG